MNLPLHKIHDTLSGYGRLLMPVYGGRWLAWFDMHGLRLTDKPFGFHNCTKTGVY